MSHSRAITALTMGALLGVIVTAAGCSADECTKASEHFSQCLGADIGANGLNTSAPRCESEYLCSSRCVNTSDCDVLREVFHFNGDAEMSDAGMSDAGMSDEMSDAAKQFLACRSQCLSEQ
jgi:hypothetical protein